MFLFSLSFILFSCEKNAIKENNKSIQGTWQVKAYSTFDSANVVVQTSPILRKDTIFALHEIISLSNATHTISFFESPQNAYSAAMKGVYKIDYTDSQLTDLVDTFYYTINKKELVVIKKTTGKKVYSNIIRKPLLNIIPLSAFRYNYEVPSGNNFKLDATENLNNTVCFFELEKIN